MIQAPVRTFSHILNFFYRLQTLKNFAFFNNVHDPHFYIMNRCLKFHRVQKDFCYHYAIKEAYNRTCEWPYIGLTHLKQIRITGFTHGVVCNQKALVILMAVSWKNFTYHPQTGRIYTDMSNVANVYCNYTIFAHN